MLLFPVYFMLLVDEEYLKVFGASSNHSMSSTTSSMCRPKYCQYSQYPQYKTR